MASQSDPQPSVETEKRSDEVGVQLGGSNSGATTTTTTTKHADNTTASEESAGYSVAPETDLLQSSPVPDATTAEPHAAVTTARTAEPGNNDAVSALQAMFPAMDRTIISEVLAAHGGNADAASFALLELNNPDAAPPVGTGNNHASTTAQMQSDEEYARQLMLQMEHEHQQEFGRPLNSAPDTTTRRHAASEQANYSQLNYVPRQRNRHGQPAGGPSAGGGQPDQYRQGEHGDDQSQGGLGQWLGGQTGPDGRWKHQDEIDQLTEQFGKIADTGKKTFNSFLSKAKDKYAQAAQQRAMQAQSSGQSGSGEGPGLKSIGGFKLPAIPSPWQGGTGFKPGEKPMSPEREDLRSGAFRPDSRSSVMKDYSQSPSRPTSRPSGVERRSSSDDDAPVIQINKSLPATSQSQPIRATSSTNAPILSSSPATASPAFGSSPSHISQHQSRNSFTSGSPAKVQMLPRQTINLLDQNDRERNSRSASPAAGTGAVTTGTTASNTKKDRDYDDDSDSDVEYVRNPFNDDD